MTTETSVRQWLTSIGCEQYINEAIPDYTTMPALRRTASGENEQHVGERRDSDDSIGPLTRKRSNSGSSGTKPFGHVPVSLLSRFNVGAKPDVGKGKDKKRNKKTQQPPSLERYV